MLLIQKERAAGLWLASNRSVGIAWGVLSAMLLAIVLGTESTFEVLRDGFRLGTFGLVGATIMLIASVGVAMGSNRAEINQEALELIAAKAIRYVWLMLLSLAAFGYVLTLTGLAPAIAGYSSCLYYAFGVRRPLHLLGCTLLTTVLVTAIFASIVNHLVIF